jgi:hypothetical protein
MTAITRMARATAISLTLSTVAGCSRPECKNDALYGLPSPDGAFIAFVFQRTCEQPHGVSTQVSLMPFHESLRNEPGNVLSVPGTQPVKVAWRGPRTLFVTGFEGATYQRTQPIDSSRIDYQKPKQP